MLQVEILPTDSGCHKMSQKGLNVSNQVCELFNCAIYNLTLYVIEFMFSAIARVLAPELLPSCLKTNNGVV